MYELGIEPKSMEDIVELRRKVEKLYGAYTLLATDKRPTHRNWQSPDSYPLLLDFAVFGALEKRFPDVPEEEHYKHIQIGFPLGISFGKLCVDVDNTSDFKQNLETVKTVLGVDPNVVTPNGGVHFLFEILFEDVKSVESLNMSGVEIKGDKTMCITPYSWIETAQGYRMYSPVGIKMIPCNLDMIGKIMSLKKMFIKKTTSPNKSSVWEMNIQQLHEGRVESPYRAGTRLTAMVAAYKAGATDAELRVAWKDINSRLVDPAPESLDFYSWTSFISRSTKIHRGSRHVSIRSIYFDKIVLTDGREILLSVEGTYPDLFRLAVKENQKQKAELDEQKKLEKDAVIDVDRIGIKYCDAYFDEYTITYGTNGVFYAYKGWEYCAIGTPVSYKFIPTFIRFIMDRAKSSTLGETGDTPKESKLVAYLMGLLNNRVSTVAAQVEQHMYMPRPIASQAAYINNKLYFKMANHVLTVRSMNSKGNIAEEPNAFDNVILIGKPLPFVKINLKNVNPQDIILRILRNYIWTDIPNTFGYISTLATALQSFTDNKLIFITGESGSGKTTASVMLAKLFDNDAVENNFRDDVSEFQVIITDYTTSLAVVDNIPPRLNPGVLRGVENCLIASCNKSMFTGRKFFTKREIDKAVAHRNLIITGKSNPFVMDVSTQRTAPIHLEGIPRAKKDRQWLYQEFCRDIRDDMFNLLLWLNAKYMKRVEQGSCVDTGRFISIATMTEILAESCNGFDKATGLELARLNSSEKKTFFQIYTEQTNNSLILRRLLGDWAARWKEEEHRDGYIHIPRKSSRPYLIGIKCDCMSSLRLNKNNNMAYKTYAEANSSLSDAKATLHNWGVRMCAATLNKKSYWRIDISEAPYLVDYLAETEELEEYGSTAPYQTQERYYDAE